MNACPERLFVTGTDTGVGKTLVCAVMMLADPKSCYWKPVQSGFVQGQDSDWIQEVTGLSAERFYPEWVRLKAPLSPHLAAAEEGRHLCLEGPQPPRLPAGHRLLIEGAGGVLVPLNEEQTMCDLISRLRVPVLVVGRTSLGTINHTLLTLKALHQAGLEVWGVVLSGNRDAAAESSVRSFGAIRRLANLPRLADFAPSTLEAAGRGLIHDLEAESAQ